MKTKKPAKEKKYLIADAQEAAALKVAPNAVGYVTVPLCADQIGFLNRLASASGLPRELVAHMGLRQFMETNVSGSTDRECLDMEPVPADLMAHVIELQNWLPGMLRRLNPFEAPSPSDDDMRIGDEWAKSKAAQLEEYAIERREQLAKARRQGKAVK